MIMKERFELHIDINRTQAEVSNHFYLTALSGVNEELLKREIPIGPHMTRAVEYSLSQIREDTGSVSLPTLHGREAVALFKDGSNHLLQGSFKQAGIHLFGFFANVGGFLATGMMTHAYGKIGRDAATYLGSNDNNNNKKI